MLTGLLTPSAGTVTVLGHQLPRDAERRKRRIDYMPQKFSLYDDLTVAENLVFVAEIDGLGHRVARQRISAVLSTYALRQTPTAPEPARPSLEDVFVSSTGSHVGSHQT